MRKNAKRSEIKKEREREREREVLCNNAESWQPIPEQIIRWTPEIDRASLDFRLNRPRFTARMTENRISHSRSSGSSKRETRSRRMLQRAVTCMQQRVSISPRHLSEASTFVPTGLGRRAADIYWKQTNSSLFTAAAMKPDSFLAFLALSSRFAELFPLGNLSPG